MVTKSQTKRETKNIIFIVTVGKHKLSSSSVSSLFLTDLNLKNLVVPVIDISLSSL